MKKINKFRYIAIGMILTLSSCVVTPAFAAANTEVVKQITASFTSNGKPITVYVNGTKTISKDANGNAVSPFVVDGTTYLPVRVIAEALGKSVTWEDATASVKITDNANLTISKYNSSADNAAIQDTDKQLIACFTFGGKPISIYVSGSKITPKDGNGNEVSPFVVDGTTYLPVRAIAEALGKEVAWDDATTSVNINDMKVITVKKDDTTTKDNGTKLTTIKNDKGEYHDKLEYTFTLDKDAVGEWKNVGWYPNMKDFNPQNPSTQKKWFIGMSIYSDGTMVEHTIKGGDINIKNESGFHWTDGYILDLMKNLDVVPAYTTDIINGKTYMFVEWKSADYVKYGKISYYVFEKTSDTPASETAK